GDLEARGLLIGLSIQVLGDDAEKHNADRGDGGGQIIEKHAEARTLGSRDRTIWRGDCADRAHDTPNDPRLASPNLNPGAYTRFGLCRPGSSPTTRLRRPSLSQCRHRCDSTA